MSALARVLTAVRTSKRSEAITLEELGQLLAGRQGTDAKTLTVSERRALGLAAWYSGVRFLAESVAFLPTKATRLIQGEKTRRSLPPWIRLPDQTPDARPLTTWAQLRELWMYSVLNRGSGYGWKQRDSVGRVVGMRYLHPDRVKPLGIGRDEQRRFRVRFGRGEWVDATSRDVFHFLGPSLDGVTGISPIQWHATNLGIAAAADDFAGRYFKAGAVISNWVQLTKGTRRTIEEIKTELKEFHEGVQNAHDLAVLSDGAEYKTAQLTAKDAQILEARQWSVLEIARILRLPPHKLYDLTRATFSNIEQQSIEAVTDGVRPWVERLEDQLNADPDLSAQGVSIEFEMDGLLRGDSKTRAEVDHFALQDGYLTLAEARFNRNLEPRPGMDVVYRPAAMHVVDAATGEIILPAGAPTAGDASDTNDPPATDPAASNGDRAATIDDLAELLGGGTR